MRRSARVHVRLPLPDCACVRACCVCLCTCLCMPVCVVQLRQGAAGARLPGYRHADGALLPLPGVGTGLSDSSLGGTPLTSPPVAGGGAAVHRPLRRLQRGPLGPPGPVQAAGRAAAGRAGLPAAARAEAGAARGRPRQGPAVARGAVSAKGRKRGVAEAARAASGAGGRGAGRGKPKRWGHGHDAVTECDRCSSSRHGLLCCALLPIRRCAPVDV